MSYTITYDNQHRVQRDDDKLEFVKGAVVEFAGHYFRMEERRSPHSPHCIDCRGTTFSPLCHSFVCNAHDRKDGKDIILVELGEKPGKDYTEGCPLLKGGAAGTVQCLCCDYCLPPSQRVNGEMCGHPSAGEGNG